MRLVTRNALDYETQTDYEVIITVRDNIANNGGSRFAVDDEITVIITVTDDTTEIEPTNSAPVFVTDGTSTTRSVAEDTADAADMRNIDLPVVATDVNGDELEYTLGGTHAALFNIESTTDGGQLKTKVALDYETKTDYEVTVTATDDGAGTLSDTIRVTITVMDVNEAPEFPETCPN